MSWLSTTRLSLALAATLATGSLAGCEVTPAENEERASIEATAVPPTFADDIASLVFRECTTCHREGGSAPFALDDYSSVERRRDQILAVTESGFMPPWKPVAGYGQFADERELDEGELALLQRWIAANCPEGDPARTPKPPVFPGGWQLGEPDVVLELSSAFEVRANGFDLWQCFVLPTDFGEERFIRSVEIMPSNPRVVHHLIAYANRSGAARELDPPDFEGMCVDQVAIDDMLGGWAPGLQPTRLPEGFAFRLPDGADIVLDAHFQTTGKPELEQTRIGLSFTEVPPTTPLTLMWIGAKGLIIPPGEESYRVVDRFELPVDVEITALLPHAHYICRDVRAWAELPDGTERPLIWIDDWDFNWQGQYTLAEPLYLPKGSVLACVYEFDNSARPANPYDPPRRVIGGSNSIDEMASFYFQVVLSNERELELLNEALGEHAEILQARTADIETWSTWIVESFDSDRDLSLDAVEEQAAGAFVEQLWEARFEFPGALDFNRNGKLDADEEARLRRAVRAWDGIREL